MASSPDPTPAQVRILAAAGLVAELGLLAWEAWDEWEIAVPGLLLVHLVGLLGFGLYRLMVRWWRQRVTHEELFVSSGLFAALVAASMTYAGGEWMGLRSVLGTVIGGVVVGTTLVLARLAIWGPMPEVEPPEQQVE